MSKVSSGLQKHINSKVSPVSNANAVSFPINTHQDTSDSHTPSYPCVKNTVNSKKSDPSSGSDKSRHNLEKPSTSIISSNPCTTLFTKKAIHRTNTCVSMYITLHRQAMSTSHVNQADSGTRVTVSRQSEPVRHDLVTDVSLHLVDLNVTFDDIKGPGNSTQDIFRGVTFMEF